MLMQPHKAALYTFFEHTEDVDLKLYQQLRLTG